MNWKKALLVVVLLGVALMLFVVATVGIAVTAAAVAVAESGVVEPVIDAVSEVTDNAERLRVDIDENTVTLTDPDSGRSRVIVSGQRFRGDWAEVHVPEITITDPNSGETRVIVPDLPRRVPRVVFDAEDHIVYWPGHVLGTFFRGLFTLLAIGMVATGAWLLLRNRRTVSAKEKGEIA